MGFVDLLVVAMIPVIQVLFTTGVGLFMAVDSVNLLGPEARHSLNNVTCLLCVLPALVISSLAETITFDSLVSLWFMPINILLTFVIGSALAWFLIQITRTPPHLHGLVIGCCSAGNVGNLLLIVVPAVCQEANSPFGDSSACSTSAEAYASLSMACAEMPGSGSVKRIQVPVIEKIFHFINMIGEKIEFKMIFAPSTVAAILGFMIGSVSQIRKALIGDSAPLRALHGSASLLGDPATPCMTLIVGANLLNGLKRSGVGLHVIIGVILVRYLFMPLLGIGIVKAACSLGMVGSDMLYQFVLMIQYAVPPGMSVGIIAELLEVGESECSVIMLWSYLLGAFSLTICPLGVVSNIATRLDPSQNLASDWQFQTLVEGAWNC
ncbi:Auxin efflux carrier family protein isoform 1 [Hibiscus syriacus]|uniref:Auxin efflux carrier family protein isoform 1 n=1 Tax=Hibiscus syriacus TaxID=106335 RepID=A0A6A3CXS8_HIBSY|nr:Auxin efflux carrier family protein isoform 1 [Hibiscus syriacus]